MGIKAGQYLPSEYIEKAMEMAKKYHEGQMRRGGNGMLPYYEEHVLNVYKILKDECGVEDVDVLTMALLHDTVEDTECTFEEIEECFGTEIMEQVKLLTRQDKEPFSIYARRLFANGTYKAIIVKMADRLHNLRTIIYMPDKRWIEKKVVQTYTDILNPLSDTLLRIDPIYNDKIKFLAELIEEQIITVHKELGM